MSLRIRTIARLTGVREATLRAWERRYGFPRPARGENNYRVYSRDEVEAVRRVAQLLHLCDGFLLPLLREMADRLDVAREHLASALVRQRLRALVLAPAPSTGPRAVLACPPGETHEGGLLGLGVHLKSMGWRLAVLGADTPAAAVASAVTTLEADVAALSLVMPRPPAEVEALLSEMVRAVACPVAVGGPAAKDNVRRVLAAGAHFVETAQDVAEVASARLRAVVR